MKRTFLFVCLWALSSLLGACSSFEGKIIREAEPRRTPGAPVFSIPAAVVVNSELRNLKLTLHKNIYAVHPEVLEVMAHYLGEVFSRVDLVDEYALDPSRYPLLLVPQFNTNIDYDTINVDLRWRVLESTTGRQVAIITVKESTEQEKTFMENISNHSLDLSVAYTSDRIFSRMLYQTALATISRFKESQPLRQYAQRFGQSAEKASNSTVQPSVLSDAASPTIVILSPKMQRGLGISLKKGRITVVGKASDRSGVAEVIVNGKSAALDDKGNFSAEAMLKVGENEITVTATNLRGYSTSERFTLVRESEPVAAASEQDLAQPLINGKNYALLIGINAYRQLDRLKTAINDAEEIARILVANYGFETKMLLDGAATHDGIMKELNALRTRLTPNDRLLIYYAGHGILDKSTDASYWLPVDAETNDDTKWIDSRRISDQLKRISARQVLVVADSCYAGTLTRQADVELSGSDTRQNYLRKLQEKPSRILIASGGNEPVSDAGGSGHSLFAATFISALLSPPTRVFTASELLITRIKESVAGRTEQTPEYKIMRNSGHQGGDFVFEKLH